MKQSLEWKSNWIKNKRVVLPNKSKTRKPNYKVRYIVQRSITYILLTFAALLVFMPFYWMVLTALKSDYAVEIRPPQLFTLKLHFGKLFGPGRRRDLTFTLEIPDCRILLHTWNRRY